MTRRSIMEYAQAIQGRYIRAGKEEKGKMLDEFMKVTGLHRKAAIRLLKRLSQSRVSKRRGRPRKYEAATSEALKIIWEASDRLCSKRLQPFLPEMVKVLRQHGEQRIDASLGARLCRMSASTIDRLLTPYRRLGGPTWGTFYADWACPGQSKTGHCAAFQDGGPDCAPCSADCLPIG